MASTFLLPAVGDTMVEGEIVEWFVAVGDEIDVDQLICSIETDKSVVEMSTPYAGTVLQLGAEIGETIEVGEPLIVVGESGEVAPPEPQHTPTQKAPSPIAPIATVEWTTGVVRSPVVRKLATDLDVALDSVAGTGHGGQITRADVEAAARAAPSGPPSSGPSAIERRVMAMPKVRRAARERGIDLRATNGSGPNGVIRLKDLDPSDSDRQEIRQRLSPIRRSIGNHLTESATTIPQFTAMVDVEVSALLETRTALQERTGGPIPLDALVMGLLVPVLRDHPRMNARLDAEAGELVASLHYDIGVAVDTPDGLIVPVVRHVDDKTTSEIAQEILRLATAARGRSIHPDELVGATCTLNNVGAVGLEKGTPILPIGTTAIIAPGRARPTVQLRNGVAIEVPVMTLSATFDHRAVDGGDAGRFLTQLRDHLQVPALGLL